MKRWVILTLACALSLLSLLDSTIAEANSRNYWRGRYNYRKYRCRSSIRYLERAIKSAKRRLKRKYLIRAYKMLASCYYRRRRRSKARKRYRAALRITLRAGLPGRVGRRGRRYFRRVRSRFRKEQKKSGPAFSFSMKPKGPGPVILPNKPNSRAVPAPMAVPKVPGVKLPDDGPGGKSIKNANRAVAARRPAPPDDGGLFRQSGTASAQPYQAKEPSKAAGVLRRHRLSMIIGGVGVASLIVGIALGASFQGQKESLGLLLSNPGSSVAQLEEAHANAAQVVVPANILIVTGSLVTAGAIGVLIAEVVMHNRKQKKAKKP